MFEYGEKSYKLLYPIVMGFCNTSAIIFLSLLQKQEFNHPFVTIAIIFLAESLIFFFFLISKQRTISQKTKNTITPLIHANNNKLQILPGKHKIKLLFMILPLSLFEYSSTLCSTYLRGKNLSLFDLTNKVLLIVITTCLSMIILKYKYYKHHLVGIITLFIGVVIFTLLDYISIPVDNKDNNTIVTVLLFCFLTILYQVITALQECFEKYLMESKFVHPHVIVSLEGFSGTFYVIISFLILNHIDCKDTNVFCPNKNEKVENFTYLIEDVSKNYIYLIGLLISFVFYNICRSLTNYNFSPSHRAIADTISFILTWICKFIVPSLKFNNSNLSVGYYILAIIAICIMIIAICIYLEIIIVNVFGIGKNTQKKISIREIDEMISKIEISNIDEDDSIRESMRESLV